MAIIDLQRRLHEAGRIRIGEQVATNNGKTRPAKLSTFRFTSGDRRSLDAIAAVYGGKVQTWDGAPTGEKFELYSEAAELEVLIPPEHMAYSQFYELWSGGGCQRRCDGSHMSDEKPCICDPDERECKPHTRLSVMLKAVQGTGLWRLDTQGYYAAVELGGAMELATLIARSSGRAILPGRLRLDQRMVKRPNQPTRQFAVPVLDLDVDLGAVAVGGPPSVEIAQPAAPALTPIPRDALPAPSLSEQIHAVDEPKPRQRRANAAEPVKKTGLPPKPLTTPEADPETGELLPEPPPTNGPKPATPKQIAMIKGLQKRAELTAGDLKAVIDARLNRETNGWDDLTSKEASAVIDHLQGLWGEPAPREPALVPGEEPF